MEKKGDFATHISWTQQLDLKVYFMFWYSMNCLLLHTSLGIHLSEFELLLINNIVLNLLLCPALFYILTFLQFKTPFTTLLAVLNDLTKHRTTEKLRMQMFRSLVL